MNKLSIKAAEATRLWKSTPFGVIKDADTILLDAIEKADFEESGIAYELLSIYEQAERKEISAEETFEKLFECIADVKFNAFLNRVLMETTRGKDYKEGFILPWKDYERLTSDLGCECWTVNTVHGGVAYEMDPTEFQKTLDALSGYFEMKITDVDIYPEAGKDEHGLPAIRIIYQNEL